jgi:hypothetical protein
MSSCTHDAIMVFRGGQRSGVMPAGCAAVWIIPGLIG